MKTMTLTAEVGHIEAVLQFINEELEAHDVPMKAVMQINIAVEELFVNIAHYAYNPDVGEAVITIDVDEAARCVVIRFIDGGKPYNPLSREDPDVTLSAEDREIGGLGVFMVKKSMDDMSYTYEDGQNVMIIRKSY